MNKVKEQMRVVNGSEKKTKSNACDITLVCASVTSKNQNKIFGWRSINKSNARERFIEVSWSTNIDHDDEILDELARCVSSIGRAPIFETSKSPEMFLLTQYGQEWKTFQHAIKLVDPRKLMLRSFRQRKQQFFNFTFISFNRTIFWFCIRSRKSENDACRFNSNGIKNDLE